MDLRCPAKLHGVLENEVIEVKCGSKFCGAKPGTVVLHRFNATTGDLVETLRFKDPARKEQDCGAHRHSAAVRPA